MLQLRNRGSGAIKSKIVSLVQPVLEAWTGQSLVPTSVYGIRVYQEGAVLAPHVDRLPLVTSAIINVAQDVDEWWPLEVVGHDGVAVNITMEPDEMILYESHSVLHGRPFPLQGRFYANVFVHFEPHGHTTRHEARGGYGSSKAIDYAALYAKARAKDFFPATHTHELPDYIKPNSKEEKSWRQLYIYHEDKRLGVRLIVCSIVVVVCSYMLCSS